LRWSATAQAVGLIGHQLLARKACHPKPGI
jgi:hypothetical protein